MAVHDTEAAASTETPDELTERIRISLPAGRAQPIPIIGGMVTLLSAESAHLGPDLMESSSGVIELRRDNAVVEVPFDANRAFEAWGYRMAVFGASGSYELSIFPPGAAFEP